MDLTTFKDCGTTGQVLNTDRTACENCGPGKVPNSDKTACQCDTGKVPNPDGSDACVPGRKSLTTDEANPHVSKNLEKCQKITHF